MKTVIIGATPNAARYSYRAAGMLTERGHEIVPVGIKKGNIFGKEILDIRTKPTIESVDTVTLYIGPQHQLAWYDYILSLRPRRVIFNPGAENPELIQKLEEAGIDVIEACMMVRTNQY